MRLSDLDPRIIKGNAERGVLVFDCPTHRNHRFRVAFHAGGARAEGDVYLWKASGTLDRLTLTPSVNAVGCWHGFVTDGEMVGVEY
jgi:Family of unknown function (DUF6527)